MSGGCNKAAKTLLRPLIGISSVTLVTLSGVLVETFLVYI